MVQSDMIYSRTWESGRRTRTHAALLLVLMLLGTTAPAARAASPADSLGRPPASSPAIGDTLLNDVVETGTDAILFFTSPARFSLRQWGIVGWTLAGTAMAGVADETVRSAFAGREGSAITAIRKTGDIYGIWIPATAITAGLYIGGLAFDEPRIRRAGRHVFQSVLHAAAITTTVKVLTGRHRPALEDGPYGFEGPSFKDDYNSFASGHTTMAFAISSALAAEIDNPWASAGLYTIAGATALSRLYADRHWGSDVVFGAVVGTVCGYGVVHLHDTAPGEAGLMIFPTLNGVAAVWQF